MKELLGLLAVWSIALSGAGVVVGVALIRRGERVWHHRVMLLATALAALFLVFYLAKWGLYGTTAYGGPEAWRGAYYLLLFTHTLLAALSGPLALYVIWRALRGEYVESVLSVMGSCGMYDYAGEWLYRMGMPAKSGVTGGVIAVLPGQLGIGVFSPPLDTHGNSVRGLRACEDLSRSGSIDVWRGV